MKYKHTIQIITKDIQEIEKLLDNFNNYSTVPAIELDLALSKLRNIYELLLMFRESPDGFSFTEPEFIPEIKTASSQSVLVNKNSETIHAEQKEEEIITKDFVTGENDTENSNVNPAEIISNSVTAKDDPADTTSGTTGGSNPQRNPETPLPDNGEPKNHENLITENPVQKTKVEKKEYHEALILGDRYKPDKKFINERLGENSSRVDMKTKLQGTPITSIAGSIGINDKFYLIRELFKGNPENFRQTMEILDHSPNFNEAFNYLIEHFDWDMESEPVQQLLSLVRRKFISQGNE